MSLHLILNDENYHKIEYNKAILLEVLKKYKIRFSENPIKELTFLGLNKHMDNIYIPEELSQDNLKICNKLKTKTNIGIYNGLKLSRIKDNSYIIITTMNIQKNNLLFVVNNEYCESNKKQLIQKIIVFLNMVMKKK